MTSGRERFQTVPYHQFRGYPFRTVPHWRGCRQVGVVFHPASAGLTDSRHRGYLFRDKSKKIMTMEIVVSDRGSAGISFESCVAIYSFQRTISREIQNLIAQRFCPQAIHSGSECSR